MSRREKTMRRYHHIAAPTVRGTTVRAVRAQSAAHAIRHQENQCEAIGRLAWKSANRPKTVEGAKALEEFVTAIERRHGAEIWVR